MSLFIYRLAISSWIGLVCMDTGCEDAAIPAGMFLFHPTRLPQPTRLWATSPPPLLATPCSSSPRSTVRAGPAAPPPPPRLHLPASPAAPRRPRAQRSRAEHAGKRSPLLLPLPREARRGALIGRRGQKRAGRRGGSFRCAAAGPLVWMLPSHHGDARSRGGAGRRQRRRRRGSGGSSTEPAPQPGPGRRRGRGGGGGRQR